MPLPSVVLPQTGAEAPHILRVSIDGEWETQEFGEFLRCLTFLYRVAAADSFVLANTEATEFNFEMTLIHSLDAFGDTPRFFRDSGPFKRRAPFHWLGASPTGRLRLAQVHYGSPGFTDLAGVGRALERMCEFLKYLIELAAQARMRKLDVLLKEQEVETKKIENTRMRLENASKLLELSGALGCSPEVQRRVLFSIQEAQDSLFDLSEDGKIVKTEKFEG